MEPDFSGWATKAGIKCADGLTIMTGAFKHQDQVQVPLVWHHNGTTDPQNILGHALLTSKDEGVWADCFFNDTEKAKHAKELVKHKDINALSIWANELLKKGKTVLHGAIKEVSLVMAGANPGALIDPISIRHSDGTTDEVEDEAIIYTGLELAHEAASGGGSGDQGGNGNSDDESIQDVIDTFDEKQLEVFHYAITEALKTSKPEPAGTTAAHSKTPPQKGSLMHNVFDQSDKDKGNGNNSGDQQHTLTHDAMKGIVDSAMKNKTTLKHAVEEYALQHGIENIGILFPQSKLLDPGSPMFLSRRMEWVSKVLDGVGKSPFSRVRTRNADITFEEARAKGYIKGNMKKEEFFPVAQRETTPQTIYKKQKMDRDDILDITDYDSVAWLEAEMRLMLNEELARAILVGDGRDIADPDKIREDKIRPIATDDPFYTVAVNIDLNDANSTIEEVHDAILLNRQYYKGTGMPTMFTTLSFLAQSLLARDNMGRKIYNTQADFQTAMMVSEIVPVEVMDDHPDIACILVNLTDYNVGQDRGGEVSMFDFFDIDYNQYKYLIETRCSGALVRPRSAMVIRTTGAGSTPATATPPAWDAATFTVTIPVDANVDYVNATTGAALPDGDNVVAEGDVLTVRAVAAAGHYLTNVKVEWSFMHPTGA